MCNLTLTYSCWVTFLFSDNICSQVLRNESLNLCWVVRVWLVRQRSFGCLRRTLTWEWRYCPDWICLVLLRLTSSLSASKHSCINNVFSAVVVFTIFTDIPAVPSFIILNRLIFPLFLWTIFCLSLPLLWFFWSSAPLLLSVAEKGLSSPAWCLILPILSRTITWCFSPSAPFSWDDCPMVSSHWLT